MIPGRATVRCSLWMHQMGILKKSQTTYSGATPSQAPQHGTNSDQDVAHGNHYRKPLKNASKVAWNWVEILHFVYLLRAEEHSFFSPHIHTTWDPFLTFPSIHKYWCCHLSHNLPPISSAAAVKCGTIAPQLNPGLLACCYSIIPGVPIVPRPRIGPSHYYT